MTTRVRLATMIAIAPPRDRPPREAGGLGARALRRTPHALGLAIGARVDDYEVAGVDHRGRGRRLSEQLAYLRGGVDQVESARRGRGSSCSSVAPEARRSPGWPLWGRVRARGRAAACLRGGGSPRAGGLDGPRAPRSPTPLGPGILRPRRRRRGNDYLRDYYAFTGGFVERIVAANLTSARAIKDFVRGYEEAGCDELVLLPTVADIGRSTGSPRRMSDMKVSIVGGGPAGLYLAILLKADREIDVSVVERTAPDATFGWGVVFSEETSARPRRRPGDYLAITDTFVRWDRVDIHYRGRVLGSQGHSFSAIARKDLLEILQRRCFALGVDLAFQVEVDEAPPAPTWSWPPTASTASFDARWSVSWDVGRAQRLQVRLVRHRPRLRRLHVHLPGDRARALPGARLSVRRAHEHVHRRVPEPLWRRAGLDQLDEARASRSASGSSPTTSAGTGCSRTARSGSTFRRL